LQREELRLLEELHPYRAQAGRSSTAEEAYRESVEGAQTGGTYSAKSRNTYESIDPNDATVQDFIMEDLRKAVASSHAAHLVASGTNSGEFGHPKPKTVASPESSCPPDDGEGAGLYHSIDFDDRPRRMLNGTAVESAEYSNVASTPLKVPMSPGGMRGSDSFDDSNDTYVETRKSEDSIGRVLNMSVGQRRSILGDGFLPKWEFEAHQNYQKPIHGGEGAPLMPGGGGYNAARHDTPMMDAHEQIRQASAVAVEVAAAAKRALQTASDVSKRHEHVLTYNPSKETSYLPLPTSAMHQMGIGAVAVQLEQSLAEFKKTYEDKSDDEDEAPPVEEPTVEELRQDAEAALDPKLGIGENLDDIDEVLGRLEAKINQKVPQGGAMDELSSHILGDDKGFQFSLPTSAHGGESQDPDLLHKIEGLRHNLTNRIREIDRFDGHMDMNANTVNTFTIPQFRENHRLDEEAAASRVLKARTICSNSLSLGIMGGGGGRRRGPGLSVKAGTSFLKNNGRFFWFALFCFLFFSCT
jgi:hypothetical protein